jgi:hypothetical protein
MARLHTITLNLGIFWWALERMLVNFMAIWYFYGLLLYFVFIGIVCVQLLYFVFIWNMVCPGLVHCTKKNLASLNPTIVSYNASAVAKCLFYLEKTL